MKLKTFAMNLFLLIVGATVLISCNKNTDDEKNYAEDFVKVEGDLGYYSFITRNGFILTPTNQVAFQRKIGTRYGLIGYNFTDEAWQKGQASKKIDIEAVRVIPIHEAMLVEKVLAKEGNATIYSVGATESQLIPISFFNEHTLMIPIGYYHKKAKTIDEAEAELQKHIFQFHYKIDDPESSATNLRLYLQHTVADIDNQKDRIEIMHNIFATNINEALTYHKTRFNKAPKTIEIVYETATHPTAPGNPSTTQVTLPQQ